MPFDYTHHMRAVLEDVVRTMPVFAHVDMDRVYVAVTQTRVASQHGIFAACTPLRFEGGADTYQENGVTWRMPELTQNGRPALYLVTFYLPRFQDLPYAEKMKTICHELHHISPDFDGDLRRFPGRNYAHGPSRKWFDAQFAPDLDQCLQRPRPAHHAFLDLTFRELQSRYGGVTGRMVRRLRPYRVA